MDSPLFLVPFVSVSLKFSPWLLKSPSSRYPFLVSAVFHRDLSPFRGCKSPFSLIFSPSCYKLFAPEYGNLSLLPSVLISPLDM